MQLFQNPFDANTVKPNEAFDPIPEAWYNLVIRESEAKPTKDNESGYLVFQIEVLDGEHKGRRLFDNLHLWNKSVQASEIAQRQLSAYCHATGVLILQDSTQLHGIPFRGKVGIRKDEGYDAKNVIKAVKHIQDSTAQVTATAAPTPFGMNPSLPAQPFPAPTSAQQPAPPWGTSTAAPTPVGPPAQQTPWAPPSTPAAPPAGNSAAPWRK